MWRHVLSRTARPPCRRNAWQPTIVLCASCVLSLAALAGSAPAGSAVSAQPRARAARALRATDLAKLHYLQRRSSGSWLFEEGSATGTLPGSMHVYADIGPTLTATFTIYTRGGTIVGHAAAAPHGSGRYESFAGSLVATGGTGSYTRAHGRAGFYGVLDRLDYAMTVQTTGTLSY
jgi:hypothetical protein